jgi:hypothetical protein
MHIPVYHDGSANRIYVIPKPENCLAIATKSNDDRI